MRLGYVRVDDDPSQRVLRAYPEPVDIDAPLSAMSLDYDAVARIAIAGDTAEITGLHGKVTRAAYRDFEDQMRARGVTRIFWERHRANGEIKPFFRSLE